MSFLIDVLKFLTVTGIVLGAVWFLIFEEMGEKLPDRSRNLNPARKEPDQ